MSTAEEWLTIAEAATRARRHEQTIRKAAREYLRTGRSGLEAYQEHAGCAITVPVVGLDRWVRKQAPRPSQQAKLRRVG